jgi:hypothetical protein
MAFAITGFNTVAQNFISRQIASNFYKKAPYLAVLGALTIGNNNKDSLEIGRPGVGEILTGGLVSQVEKKRLGTINGYIPRIQGFETSNTAYRQGSANDGRTSLPDVADKSSRSHGQAMQFGAEYRWCHMDTPILIWHEDKIRAGKEGTREGQGIAMGQLINEATEVGMQDMLNKLAVDVYDSTLTAAEQNHALWKAPIGLLHMMHNESHTNPTMARVDRTNEPLWRGQVNSTLTAIDIRKIIDDANFSSAAGRKGLKVYGNGADLIIVGTTLYQDFKKQVLAQGGTVMLNGLPAMAKMGVKKELLQIDNTVVMYDPFLTDANTVLVQDSTVFKFMIHPDYNFKVGKFIDNTTTGIDAELYDYAHLSLRFMFACDNPALTVRYTAIGT